MLHTKIICTIGPASDSPEVLENLADAGMNVARLNFSHGTHDSHRNIVEKIRLLNTNREFPVAILLDTKGPEIRTGDQHMKLITGTQVRVVSDPELKDERHLFVDYPHLTEQLGQGNHILLDSGLVKLEILENHGDSLACRVLDGGTITPKRHVNLPGISVKLPGITLSDRKDLEFALEENVDVVALSFLRNRDTVLEVREMFRERGEQIKLIAKIENQEGVDNLEEIIQVTDGIMVARGDLGIEIDMEELPQIQRKIAYLCAKYGKRLIVATQMLESMMENPVPTRAEITDIANAVFEQSDAIMLSGETSTGKYPVRCVETLVRIARRTEVHPGVQFTENLIQEDGPEENQGKGRQMLAAAATKIARQLKVPGMLVITRKGRGATKMANLRVRGIPIFAFTESKKTISTLMLLRGVYPYLLKFDEDPELTIQNALRLLKKKQDMPSGISIVVVADIMTGEGYVNCLQVRTLPED